MKGKARSGQGRGSVITAGSIIEPFVSGSIAKNYKHRILVFPSGQERYCSKIIS